MNAIVARHAGMLIRHGKHMRASLRPYRHIEGYQTL